MMNGTELKFMNFTIDGVLTTALITPCEGHFEFDEKQKFRAAVSIIIAVISLVGNLIFLSCLIKLPKWDSIHIVALNLCIADLAFTMFVTLFDTGWQISIVWKGTLASCKFLEFTRSAACNISSLMIVVLSIDRALVILRPDSTNSNPKRRAHCLVCGAWIISLLSAVPTSIYFGLMYFTTSCKLTEVKQQCVDFATYGRPHHYHMYQMALSFIIPFLITVVVYGLILKKMKGFSGIGVNTSNPRINHAVKRTYICAALVTSSFLLLWGPYWSLGIYEIFYPQALRLERMVRHTLICIMYLNAAIHPFICGAFFFKSSFFSLHGLPSILRKIKYFSVDENMERNTSNTRRNPSAAQSSTANNYSETEQTQVRVSPPGEEEDTELLTFAVQETKT